MQVYTKRRYRSADRMGEPHDPAREVMALLRELTKSQAQLNDTIIKGEQRQQIMEETLRQLALGKTNGEQNGQGDDSVTGRSNVQRSHSRPLMPTFPQKSEAPRGDQEPTFQEMQAQLNQDWRDANLEGDISFKDYVELRMKYSSGRSRGYYGHYNNDIKRKVGKINLSSFDGTKATSARAGFKKQIPTSNSTRCLKMKLLSLQHSTWKGSRMNGGMKEWSLSTMTR